MTKPRHKIWNHQPYWRQQHLYGGAAALAEGASAFLGILFS
jgi:hypothetical protein